MSKVYFIVSHTVPTEHPNAVRVANLGLIFKKLGYDVHLLGFDGGETREIEYKGMRCAVFNQISGSGLRKALRRESEHLECVKKYIQEKGMPEIIVSGLFNCKLQRYIINICKTNKVKLIETVCEWFDRSAFSGFSGFFKYINNRISLYCQFPKIKNIIAISTLHANYYKEKGCHTIVIPTLVDMAEYDAVVHNQSTNGRIQIAYAGSPAKKDYLANVIRAIGLLSIEEKSKIQLQLYGCTERSLLSLGIESSFLQENFDTIVCNGRVPYSEVKERIANADYTILLRPNKRYANAGFPTKVGESMACGTPVIANITSDLDRYIIDGQTGVVCSDETPESCAIAIKRVIELFGTQEYLEMRKNAYNTASKFFCYKTYVDLIKEFLEKISSDAE